MPRTQGEPREALQGKIQEARNEYNSQLRHRFDLHWKDEVKKFFWIATLLDPRFKKLDFFKGCEDLISPQKRTRYTTWLCIDYRVRQELQEQGLRPGGGIRACHRCCGQLCE